MAETWFEPRQSDLDICVLLTTAFKALSSYHIPVAMLGVGMLPQTRERQSVLRANNPDEQDFDAIFPVNLINKLENMIRIILFSIRVHIWF